MLLADFIEMPSQNCTQVILVNGVKNVIDVLYKNSAQIVDVIRSCECPASYVLYDLAQKMALQNSANQFTLLYEYHLDELVDLCIWSWYDLQRFIQNQPNYLEKIMSSVIGNESCCQRLMNDVAHSEDIIHYIKELAPDYDLPDRFASLSVSSVPFRL